MTEGPAAHTAGPLGILACAGPLPIEIAAASVRRGRPVHIVAFRGFASDEIARYPHETVSLGEVGKLLASFRRAGVREMVIAGGMQRPNLLALKIDWGFVQNLPTVLSLTRGGDDSVLRRIVRFFEGHDFAVLGADEVAPELLAPQGRLGRHAPSARDEVALARAASLIAGLGAFDVGQAVVASADRIFAVEGVRGTDAMLRDLGPGGMADGQGKGGVLVKLAKPGQEMRIDLPTIGAETIRRAQAAGLAGVGIGAGAAIVLERARMIEAADQSGLFVTGLPADALLPPGEVGDTSMRAIVAGPLALIGRGAPTSADRRDVAIGRHLVDVLRRHGAGRAALISREHVLAIAGALPLPAFLETQGRPMSWGRRALRSRLGVLVVDGEHTPGNELGAAAEDMLLDADLFRSAMRAGIAGIVALGMPPVGERRDELEAWANEARLFLMVEGEGR